MKYNIFLFSYLCSNVLFYGDCQTSEPSYEPSYVPSYEPSLEPTTSFPSGVPTSFSLSVFPTSPSTVPSLNVFDDVSFNIAVYLNNIDENLYNSSPATTLASIFVSALSQTINIAESSIVVISIGLEASSVTPTETPTEIPSEEPSETPTEFPSEEPTEVPSEEPTEQTSSPTGLPTPPPLNIRRRLDSSVLKIVFQIIVPSANYDSIKNTIIDGLGGGSFLINLQSLANSSGVVSIASLLGIAGLETWEIGPVLTDVPTDMPTEIPSPVPTRAPTPAPVPGGTVAPVNKLLCNLFLTSGLGTSWSSNCNADGSYSPFQLCSGSSPLVPQVTSCNTDGDVTGLSFTSHLNIEVNSDFDLAFNTLAPVLQSLVIRYSDFVPGQGTSATSLSSSVALGSASSFVANTIPTVFGSLSALTLLDLSHDGLSDTLSVSLFSGLPSLRDLRLNDNNLYGTVPAVFGALFSLTYLDLSNNLFTGAIPDSLCHPDLLYLKLSGNSFGCYPSCLSGVHNNDFVGGSLPTCTSSPSLYPTTTPSTNSPTGVGICTEVLLMDKFGDGWGNTELSLMPSRGVAQKWPLYCGENRLHHRACFYPGGNQHGDYFLLSISGYETPFPWEIFWQVFNPFDGRTYSGDFKTVMRFTYRDYLSNGQRVQTIVFDSQQSIGVLPPSSECKSCSVSDLSTDIDSEGSSGAAPGKPKPKPKPKSNAFDSFTKAPSVLRRSPPPPSTQKQATLDSPLDTTIASGARGAEVVATVVSASDLSATRFTAPRSGSSETSSSVIDSYVGAAVGSVSTVASEESASSTTTPAGPSKTSSQYEFVLPSEPTRPSAAKVTFSTISSHSVGASKAAPKAMVKARGLLEESPIYLPYTLSQQSVDWFDAEGFGVDFFLSDSTGSVELYSGTICSDSSQDEGDQSGSGRRKASTTVNGTCHIHLSDGKYAWRVTGALLGDWGMGKGISWDFCDITGGPSVEMTVQYYSGVCYPIAIKSVQTICNGGSGFNMLASDGVELQMEVRIQGVLELSGFVKQTMTNAEADGIHQAIVQELNDAKVGNIVHTTESSVKRIEALHSSMDLANPERRLSEEQRDVTSHRIEFAVAVNTHNNGLEVATAALKEYLERSMSSGLFVTRLHRLSRGSSEQQGIVSLRSFSKATLVELYVVHRTVENIEKSWTASAVVVIGGLSGLVFALVLLLQRQRRVQSVLETARYMSIDASESGDSYIIR